MKRLVIGCRVEAIAQCRRLLALLLLLTVCFSVPVHGQSIYDFSTPPRLVGGTHLLTGALYRFENVKANTDALVSIASTYNASLVKIDESALGVDSALQPEIEGHEVGGYVELHIQFVSAGKFLPEKFSTVATELGLDAETEFNQFFSVSDFTVDAGSAIEWSLSAPQSLSVRGGATAVSPISIDHPSVSVSVNDVETLIYRVGTDNRSRRHSSLLFHPVVFLDGVFTNVNDSPEAVSDRVVTEYNDILAVAAPGVLGNDRDIDLRLNSQHETKKDRLTVLQFNRGLSHYSAGVSAAMAEGHLNINSDGSYHFIPTVNFSGPITDITYVVADKLGATDKAKLDLVVNSEQSIVLADDINVTLATINIEEDDNNDGWINGLELKGAIDVSYRLGAGSQAGDRIEITNGSVVRTFELDTAMILSGRIQTEFPAPADSSIVSVAGTYIKAEDNSSSTVEDLASVDIQPTEKPIVTIVDDRDNSGFISLLEHSDNATLEIELPAGASVNDRVEIVVGNKTTVAVLGPVDIAEAKIAVVVPFAEERETLSVLVNIIDEAGNKSEVGSDSAVLDTVAPMPPTVDFLNTPNSTPTITGTTPETGDFILSVSVNDVHYASGDGQLTELSGSRWALVVPQVDALPNGIYEVTATVTDMAGNKSVDTTANELGVDLNVPEISALNVGPVSDPAPLISGSSDQPEQTDVVVATDGNIHVCESQVTSGKWSCRSRVMFPIGESTLLVSVKDEVGNVGVAELTVSIVAAGDQDNDGIPDDIEGASDSDGDGIPNYLDLDSDNDTLTDLLETAVDTDGDSIRDFLDRDSDNDSLTDLYEAEFSSLLDMDNDGAVDPSIVVGANGLADVVETEIDSGTTKYPRDSDNDGRFDFVDLDSDGDGLSDAVEQHTRYINFSAGVRTDQVRNGIKLPIDTDMDGIPDYRDLDSDQDGVPDVLEMLGKDANGDGMIDNTEDANKDGIADSHLYAKLVDTDKDGVPNHNDLDSDHDGIFDLVESGGSDDDYNGIHDDWVDKNRNSISDRVDQIMTSGTDSDQDSIDDKFDSDFVDSEDIDRDGVADVFDVDSDSNGRLDKLDNIVMELVDRDGNLEPDLFQFTGRSQIETGTGVLGGGCSLVGSTHTGRFDPVFVLLLVFSFGHIFLRNGARLRCQNNIRMPGCIFTIPDWFR